MQVTSKFRSLAPPPADPGNRQEDDEEQELPVEHKQSLLPEPERYFGQVVGGGEVGGGER